MSKKSLMMSKKSKKGVKEREKKASLSVRVLLQKLPIRMMSRIVTLMITDMMADFLFPPVYFEVFKVFCVR